MFDENREFKTKLIFGLALLLFAISILITVIVNRGDIFGTWMIVFFQGLLAIVSIFLVFSFIFYIWNELSEKIVRIEREFSEELAKMKKSIPTVAAVLVIFSDAVLLIADKSFVADVKTTLIISLLLLIIFAFANIFVVSNKNGFKIIGFILYASGLGLLLGAGFYINNWSISKLWDNFVALDIFIRNALVISLILYLSLPFIAYYYSEN